MEFDTRVQHRDPKTGKVTKHTPYTLKISRESGEVYTRDNVEYWPDGAIKRDMRPAQVAAIEEPTPLKTPSAPVEDTMDPDEALEAKLGIPSTEKLMATAKRGFSNKGSK